MTRARINQQLAASRKRVEALDTRIGQLMSRRVDEAELQAELLAKLQ